MWQRSKKWKPCMVFLEKKVEDHMDRLKICWKTRFWGPFLQKTPLSTRKTSILIPYGTQIRNIELFLTTRFCGFVLQTLCFAAVEVYRTESLFRAFWERKTKLSDRTQHHKTSVLGFPTRRKPSPHKQLERSFTTPKTELFGTPVSVSVWQWC
jgi:hypothetical protein